jgi:hypothetical protein
VPFRGGSVSEIFEGHRSASAPPLPAPLTRYQPLINRLLQKIPDDRYPAASQFLEALDVAARPIEEQTRRIAKRGAPDS